MKVTGKISIISGVGVPPMGTFEETVAAISKALGVDLDKSETGEFSPFNAYYTKALGLTIVVLDPSIFGIKEHYELQVYDIGSSDKEKTWIDISDFLIELLKDQLNISCRKL